MAPKSRKYVPLDRSVIWGVVEPDGFVAMLEERAMSLARLQFVVQHANTLGQARVILSRSEYRELLEQMDFGSRPDPLGTFDPPPSYEDGDWPEWPAAEALDWIPDSVIRQHGSVEDSVLNGPFITWLSPHEEIALSLDRAGFQMRRDDRLCGLVAGYGGDISTLVPQFDAYTNTEFEVLLGDRKAVLRTGAGNADIARLLTKHRHKACFVITGYNPASTQQSAEANEAANAVVHQRLVESGATVLPAVGRDPKGKWPAEPSWYASGLSPNVAMRIASDAGQDAVLMYQVDGMATIWWARLPLGPRTSR